jgi:hypothetical protein
VIPRYRDDPRWGQPIWNGWATPDEFNANRMKLTADEARALVARIRAGVEAARRQGLA